MDDSRVIVILGMHRSGTSCLAGSLQEAGLFLGDVVTTAPHNQKGNRENRRVMELHDRVLEASGGSWDDPPAEVVWKEEHRAARDLIIREYVGRNVWGFKDPRTLFVLSGWLEVLNCVEHVGTFRHPVAVARSLMRRNRRTETEWFRLWAMYNERLVALHDAERFPIIDFDLDDRMYRKRLAEIARWMGLSSAAQLDFFEPSLRRNRVPSDQSVPAELRGLYEELKARSRVLP